MAFGFVLIHPVGLKLKLVIHPSGNPVNRLKPVREEIARVVVEGGFGLREFRQIGMSLEEIFVRLTTSDIPTAQEGGTIQ